MMKKYIVSIGCLPFPVKWFLITEMLFGLSIGIWNVNLNFHMKSVGFSELEIGSILAFGSVVTAVLSLGAGFIGDRIGFHSAMVIGCILKGTGMVMVAFSTGYTYMFLGQLLISMGDALVLSTEFPFLLSLVDEEDRNKVYSLLVSFFLFAMIGGNFCGGYISAIIAVPSKPYLPAIFLSGLTFILLGAGRYFLPRNNVKVNQKINFLSLFKESKVILFLVYGVAGGTVFNLVTSMPNIIFREQFGLSDSKIGFIFALATLSGCISAFITPVILGRYKSASVAVILIGIYVAVFVILAFSGLQIFLIFWMISTFVRTMLPGTIDSQMLQSIPPEKQGSYSGIRIFANNIGNGFGAYTAGTVLMYWNYSIMMIIAACLGLIMLFVYSKGCRKYLG